MSRSSLTTVSGKKNADTLREHGKHFTPFWLLGHDFLPDNADHVRTMGRKALTNILNYLNFSDRSLLVHIEEPSSADSFLLMVYSEPCLDGEVTCRWAESLSLDNSTALVRNLIIDDGKSMIIAPLGEPIFDKRVITAQLPETSYVVARRKAKRHTCSGVSARLLEKGRALEGVIEDFSSSGFRVRFERQPGFRQSFFSAGDIADVELKKEGRAFFAGNCSINRIQQSSGSWDVVFKASVPVVRIFPKRTIRNPRVHLKPAPTISFEHPLLQTILQMEVVDICSSGICVCEEENECLLYPGMFIPDLKVHYAGSIVSHCSARVVYRNVDDCGNAHCGIAFLDTDMDGYTRLNQLVENALDPCAQVSGEIEPDSLWEFFFSTGFIYPKKYNLLFPSKEIFKENCRKIFQDASEIIQHFIYENNGRIYGYHSIVWAYKHSWLIHHHAGRSMGNRMGGLMVLRQTMHYLNDMHRLESSNMDYAMTYFRPENRFPRLIFGHFSKALKNRKGCSMDLFSYLSIPSKFVDVALPSGWRIDHFTDSDARALRAFYEEYSGGLLLDAMSLISGTTHDDGLEAIYSRKGLLRKMKVYSLKNAGHLAAVLVADYSSRGLNFSELLNCIKVIVVNEEKLSWEVLRKAVMQLSGDYDMERVPVMCYPSQFLEKKRVPCQKAYQLWILSVDSGDAFMEYMHKRLRIC